MDGREPGKLNTSEHIKKAALLEALEKTLGVVTSACKSVGVGRTTFYNYMKDDDEFRKSVLDIQEVAIDFAESQLHQQIKGGNVTATIFYLKTKGKRRGYVEQQEVNILEAGNKEPSWWSDEPPS